MSVKQLLIDTVAFSIVMIVCAFIGLIIGAVRAHAASPTLRYQCGDYAPYPHVTWYDCGATVKVATPAASDHQPPRFLPAVVLYDTSDRYIALEVGKTFSYSCKAALDDAQATIEKATAAGRRLVGLCIPVPTYNPADLIPASDPPAPTADNSL